MALSVAEDPATEAAATGVITGGVGKRQTATRFVLIVTPSWAITTTDSRFVPTARSMPPETTPDNTLVPLTMIVAFELPAVTVTVMVEKLLETQVS